MSDGHGSTEGSREPKSVYERRDQGGWESRDAAARRAPARGSPEVSHGVRPHATSNSNCFDGGKHALIALCFLHVPCRQRAKSAPVLVGVSKIDGFGPKPSVLVKTMVFGPKQSSRGRELTAIFDASEVQACDEVGD